MRKIISKKIFKTGEDNGYWLSFSDLMSSLLIIFLLISVSLVLSYETSIEDVQKDLNIFDFISEQIEQEFSPQEVTFDKTTGVFRINNNLLFDESRSDLGPEDKEVIINILPRFFHIILDDEFIKNKIANLYVEGFTDKQGNYDFGLILSYQRALNVYNFIKSDTTFDKYQNDLKQLVILTGRSEIDTIEIPGKTEEELNALSRRVEFKIALKPEILKDVNKTLSRD
ncbi:MAG: chemotaxis protein MotB [Thermoanaerobacterium sp.]|jgi:chemotaxis protein MotB|nr:chemotaxis protein MotB [Thermoanaerobacterium sp.]MDK2823551.1 chemotaxis protein MotB [Clostridia bacterium]